MVAAVNLHQLALEEPLSPELVLVLPPELRAQVLASLGPPVWPTPRARVTENPAVLGEPIAVVLDESIMRSLGALLAARVVQLGVIFVAVTIVILAMSLVAHAVR